MIRLQLRRTTIRIALSSIMNSSLVIFSLGVFGIAIITGSAANTITFQPGLSYSWIIPPQRRSPSLSQDRPSDDTTFDQRNESPIAPIGGYGHPPFYLRHSHEQLSLPNEFLISSPGSDTQNIGGRGFSPMPLFRQLDPQVDCDGDPTCTNVDITQQQQEQHQQSPTTIHQSNIDANPFPSSSPAITPPSDYRQQPQPDASLGQPVSWPSSLAGAGGAGGIGGGGGGIGLLFFVPESASHLPVEQLIRQQLALHRTQFPIDISINCEDAVGSSCRGRSRPASVGLLNLLPPPPPLRSIVRNTENGNYASLPLDEIDNGNSSGSGISREGKLDSYELNRKWRTIGESLVRNNLQQRQQHLQQLPQQQQQQWRLQQNQQELSIGP